MEKLRAIGRLRGTFFVLGLFIGALTVLSLRFFMYKPEQVHYHANFAVYLNGVREEFKAPRYYQEVATCSDTNDIVNPQQRSHMHEDINSAIHIHDGAVTWGSFFENIGWVIGPDFIQTADGQRYEENDQNKLNIIINGDDYTSQDQLRAMVIEDKARLLISYGPADEASLKQQFDAVAKTAAKYNTMQDPASCAGSQKITPKDRFEHLLN